MKRKKEIVIVGGFLKVEEVIVCFMFIGMI